jgi:plasmid stabilization system protein ParE
LNFSVQVRRAAELDIAEAQIWYESQRNGLGAEFHFEVSQIFSRLVETPLIYPAVHRDVRRAIVRRFPYLIWYRVQANEVIVLACTHGKQAPSKAISPISTPSDDSI